MSREHLENSKNEHTSTSSEDTQNRSANSNRNTNNFAGILGKAGIVIRATGGSQVTGDRGQNTNGADDAANDVQQQSTGNQGGSNQANNSFRDW